MIENLRNDNYLIYRMLHKEVKCEGYFSGVVDKIYRNIFDNKIEFNVSNKVYKFDIPSIISLDNEDDRIILFIYGDLKGVDLSDKALFKEINMYKGETIDDVIGRTRPNKVWAIRFKITERK